MSSSKIFCTGWQRTGTTSLARALGSLGIRTRDFPKDLLHDLDHPVLHEHEAFTDNPIPLLFRELDRACPGSRFVHTERDEEAWLASARWLFSVGRIKFDWERRPIIGEIHQRLYGTTEFEPALFLERYRRHNAEVRAYFAERPDDLLVLDVTAGEGFEKLCPFLGIPVPDHPFPHFNPAQPAWKVRLRWLAWVLRGAPGRAPRGSGAR